MFTLETRLNGMLANFTYVHNGGEIEKGIYSYSVEHHRVDKEPSVIRFKINYSREEGAEKLALLIYKEIDKRLKKENINQN